MKYTLPNFGKGFTQGILIDWKVKEGDFVKNNDILCEIETQKTVIEIPSHFEGVISKLWKKVGEKICVGELLIS